MVIGAVLALLEDVIGVANKNPEATAPMVAAFCSVLGLLS